jgi:hypothetical protein
MLPRLQPASSLITLSHILAVARLSPSLPLSSELLPLSAIRRVPSFLSGLWRGSLNAAVPGDCGESEPQNYHSVRLLPFAKEEGLDFTLQQTWNTSLLHPTVATTFTSHSPWRTGRMREAGRWTTSLTSMPETFQNSSNSSFGQED